MSKTIWLAILCLAVLGMFAASCAKRPTPPPEASAKDAATQPVSAPEAAKTQYTCSMHPEVISDKPGKCPKCHMDLVEKKAETKKSATTEAARNWYCPKHPDKSYAKGERCEVCGGELAERLPGGGARAVGESEVASKLPIGNAKDGEGHYLCPVMKNPIKDLTSAEHLELGGKVWYFCCPGCPEQFQGDPTKYAPDIEL